MARIGIVGGTGYTGLELLRLLSQHPHADLVAVTSRGATGEEVSDVFPSLRGIVDLRFEPPEDEILGRCDLVFLATPNGTAMKMVPALVEAGVRVVDLAADFRLHDPAVWHKWYGEPHACPELLAEAVYGLPEVNRELIREARIVGNPGCYPTAVQLGFLPLLERGVISSSGLIADVKSGVSGAGRNAALRLMYCEADESMSAYSVAAHRHQPEIVAGLEAATGTRVGLIFVPHLTPMIRGIHATLYARLLDVDVDLQQVFERRYGDEPFVDVMPQGSHPDTRSVRGSNTCRLAWHRPGEGDTVVVLSVEDNLVKGAAGQAIQNMNIMLGFDERLGLAAPAMVP